MSILEKYNKKPLFEYDNQKERDYINLRGLVQRYGIDKVYEIHALFINTKSRFGEAPIIVTENYFVNAPKHLTDTVKQMMNDTDVIELINNRQAGFSIYEYVGRNGHGYSVIWKQRGR
mgnify:FL=1